MDYQSASLSLALKQAAFDALKNPKALVDALETSLAQMMSQASQDLQAAQAAMGGTTPLTVGIKSIVTTRAEAERVAGQGAAIDAIKANPAITQADAMTAWHTGAQATIPTGKTMLLHDPVAMVEEYSVNLHVAGYIPDTTWASFAAFIVATPKATIQSL